MAPLLPLLRAVRLRPYSPIALLGQTNGVSAAFKSNLTTIRCQTTAATTPLVDQPFIDPKKVTSAERAVYFQQVYTELMAHLDRLTQHTRPRRSRLGHAIDFVSTAEAAQKLPELVVKWRAGLLPINQTATNNLIYRCCQADAPKVALRMLSDRVTYGLQPSLEYFHLLMRRFGEDALSNGIKDQGEYQPFQCFKAVDRMFLTFGLLECYGLKPSTETFSILIERCAPLSDKESFRRASVAAAEAMAASPPMLSLHALQALREASDRHGEVTKRNYLDKMIQEASFQP
ncbi:hypothetical protein H4R35_005416 [Dimargaris xerosporica]|nr:hypothetical protein H4R35_005416 [Dimargaris xerosporica]